MQFVFTFSDHIIGGKTIDASVLDELIAVLKPKATDEIKILRRIKCMALSQVIRSGEMSRISQIIESLQIVDPCLGPLAPLMSAVADDNSSLIKTLKGAENFLDEPLNLNRHLFCHSPEQF